MIIDLAESLHLETNAVVFTYSMQRSGQHVVIDWLCRGLSRVAHFNYCQLYLTARGFRLIPKTGRMRFYRDGEILDSGKLGRRAIGQYAQSLDYPAELYSMEDIVPSDFAYRKLNNAYRVTPIIILRDPANWLASTLKFRKTTPGKARYKVARYERLLRLAIHEGSKYQCIDFNRFVADVRYRERLASRLDMPFFKEAESALNEVPDFGGGSSFNGRSGVSVENVNQRWREFYNDPFFLSLLSSRRLRALALEFFGKDYLEFLGP